MLFINEKSAFASEICECRFQFRIPEETQSKSSINDKNLKGIDPKALIKNLQQISLYYLNTI